jgi:hypothetical protein
VRLTAKNWGEFQHYKDRAPPWIKLHKKLLDDRTFQRLPDASRALAPMLWLLASESDDGTFDGSTEELAFRLRQTDRWVDAALKPLILAGFFVVVQSASAPLAEGLRDACLETEAEREAETKTEAPKSADLFDAFWSAYPKKRAKDDAQRAFNKRKPDAALLARMLDAIKTQRASEDWQKDSGKFIPYPATWLNDGRWQDEGAVALVVATNSRADETARLLAEREAEFKRQKGPDPDVLAALRGAVRRVA